MGQLDKLELKRKESVKGMRETHTQRPLSMVKAQSQTQEDHYLISNDMMGQRSIINNVPSTYSTIKAKKTNSYSSHYSLYTAQQLVQKRLEEIEVVSDHLKNNLSYVPMHEKKLFSQMSSFSQLDATQIIEAAKETERKYQDIVKNIPKEH